MTTTATFSPFWTVQTLETPDLQAWKQISTCLVRNDQPKTWLYQTTNDYAGMQYNISLTIFFISYAIFEPLTNALLKRLTPRIFFTAIIFSWGLIMTLMGLVTSYQGLLAARFMLGVAEAGLFPGPHFPTPPPHKPPC